MKNAVLGEDYDLSVAIVEEKTIQDLNNKHRSKNLPTDILSFPLDEKNGEIFLNMEQAALEAPKFDRKLDNFIAFLFRYDHDDTSQWYQY